MASTESPIARPSSHAVAAAGVLLASVCFGCVPYFSRGLTDAGIAPHAVAFYRYVIAAIVLLPSLFLTRGKGRAILWGATAGAAMGLGWIGYVSALQSLPASTVGVLYMTYPVFTVLIAWALFSDRPTGRAVLAAAMIVAAALLASGSFAMSPGTLPLVLWALAAPLGFGFGICVLVHRLTELSPFARMASAALGSVIGLAPLMLLSAPEEILPASGEAWGLIAGIALATALVPQLIYVMCAPLVGASRTAVIGSIELPTMFAVGLLAFGEAITWPQAGAYALVLMAIGLTGSRATRNVTNTLAKR